MQGEVEREAGKVEWQRLCIVLVDDRDNLLTGRECGRVRGGVYIAGVEVEWHHRGSGEVSSEEQAEVDRFSDVLAIDVGDGCVEGAGVRRFAIGHQVFARKRAAQGVCDLLAAASVEIDARIA